MFSTSAAPFRPRRFFFFSLTFFAALCAAFTSGVAFAGFLAEKAAPTVLDSVCFFPQRLADVDAGMGGQVTAASPIKLWTMVVTGTVRSQDGDHSVPLVMPTVDFNPSDPDPLVSAATTGWNSLLTNRIVPLVKARNKNKLQ